MLPDSSPRRLYCKAEKKLKKPRRQQIVIVIAIIITTKAIAIRAIKVSPETRIIIVLRARARTYRIRRNILNVR